MTTQENSPRKLFLISTLIIVWLGGSLFGLWWFQQQAMRPFVEAGDNPAARVPEQVAAGLKSLMARAGLETDGRVTVIHLWNPDCLCNNVSARHTHAIIEEWPNDDQVRFIILAPEHLSQERLAEARTLNPGADIIRASENDKLPLTASPGLGVMTPEGDMAYFGAYGFGALCSLSDEKLFTNMIEKLLAGDSYGPFLNIAGSGCFCAWPDTPEASD